MKKIKAFILIVISALLLLPTLSIDAAAATYDEDNMWDTDVYNVDWSSGKIETWVHHKDIYTKNIFGVEKLFYQRTFVAIKVTDRYDGIIENLTRLECKYYIDGELYHVQKELLGDEYHSYYFNDLNVHSKEGQFCMLNDEVEDAYFTEMSSYPGDANYLWAWNYAVWDIEYMYVWYVNSEGVECAASFYPNGEHPLYDDEGNLIGIFDANGNLCDGITLDSNGIPVYDDTLLEVELDNQVVETIKTEKTGGDLIDTYLSEFSNLSNTAIEIIKWMVYGLGIILIGYILIKIWSLFPKRRND